MKLATTPHPHYPESWLDKEQAAAMLNQAGLSDVLTVGRCQRDSIEISRSGHISKKSLEFYIEHEKAAIARGER